VNLKNNINDPLTSVFSNSESCSFDYTAYDVPKERKVIWATVKELKLLDLPRSVGTTAKNYFSGFFDFDFAIKSINCRLNASSYLFFENEDEEGEKQYFKAKASMRRNDGMLDRMDGVET